MATRTYQWRKRWDEKEAARIARLQCGRYSLGSGEFRKRIRSATQETGAVMNKRIACLVLLASLVLSVPLLAVDGHSSQAHEHDAPARLVHLVREATRQFIDVNNAGFAEY